MLQRSVSSKNMLGGERATEKCRGDKRGNAEEEAQENKDGLGRVRRWKIERGWYIEGSSVRIIFIEKVVAEEEVKEEETLPLFVVAGETKNRGWRVRGEEKMTDKGARGSCGRSFVDLDCVRYLTEILNGISPSTLNHANMCAKSFIKRNRRNIIYIYITKE